MNQPDMSPNMIRRPGATPFLAAAAAIFSFGPAYNNQVSKWAVVMLLQAVGFILCFLPGIFVWVLAVIDSYMTAVRLAEGGSIPENEYSLPLLYQIVKFIDKGATCSRSQE